MATGVSISQDYSRYLSVLMPLVVLVQASLSKSWARGLTWENLRARPSDVFAVDTDTWLALDPIQLVVIQ